MAEVAKRYQLHPKQVLWLQGPSMRWTPCPARGFCSRMPAPRDEQASKYAYEPSFDRGTSPAPFSR